jgi:hypothetical protein
MNYPVNNSSGSQPQPSDDSRVSRRTALITAVALPTLTGCYYPQYFDVTWDEEVKLHDGSVIVVNFKFTHERLSRFSKYDRAMLRDTTMSFDAGPPRGKVSQTFKRMQPVLLNKYQGEWYAVIVPRGSGDSPNLTGQDWGPWQNDRGQWPLKLTSNGFKTMPIAEFPEAIISLNLVRNVLPMEMALLDRKHIDLPGRKAELIQKHVLYQEDKTLKKPQISPAQPKTN